ncbi:MAG: Tol biopolymer transport system component, partial [Kiritimatiellia bacterium]
MRLALMLLLATPALAGRQVAARDGANLQRPTWSPDGAYLAYEANFHDLKIIELYVGATNGPFTRVMPSTRGASSIASGFGATSSSSGKVAHELTWAPPNVGRYVYAASNAANDYDLYIQNGGAIERGPGADGGAAWSPDGQHIVFTSARTGQGDLYLIHVSSIGAPPKRLTRNPTASELFAVWSHDSQRIAFVGKGRTGDNIYMLPSLTGTPVQLTFWSGTQTAPSFSPDGKKIAFFANKDKADRFDLYVMDAVEGGEVQLVTKDVLINPGGARWTPDGEKLVFTCNNDEKFDPICMASPAKDTTVKILDL